MANEGWLGVVNNGIPVLRLTPFSGSCKLCSIETWFPERCLDGFTNSHEFNYALHATQSIFGRHGLSPAFDRDWPILGGFEGIVALRLWMQSRDRNGPARVDFVSIPRSIGSMRSLRSDSIDFAVLQDWLRFCQDNHTTNCSTSKNRIHTKLIDCETDKLVDSGDLPYLTLSYMWGQGENGPKYSEVLPRRDTLPATIKDALAATVKLGFRYLWIDRYW